MARCCRRTLHFKIGALFFIVIAALSVCLGIFFYKEAKVRIFNEAVNEHVRLLAIMDNNIADIQRRTSETATLLQAHAGHTGRSHLQQDLITSFSKIVLVAHFLPDGTYSGAYSMPGAPNVAIPLDDAQASALHARAKQIVLSPPCEMSMMKEPFPGVGNLLVVLRVDPGSGELSVVALPLDWLGDVCDAQALSDKQSLVVLCPDGTAMYSHGHATKDAAALAQTSGTPPPRGTRVMLDGEPHILFQHNVDTVGWRLLLVADEHEMYGNDLVPVITTAIIAVLAAIVATFVLSVLTSRLLTKPVQALLHSMDRVTEGDFQQQVAITGRDEVGQLGTRFNAMVGELHRLMAENGLLQLREREAELAALQAQIDPHFLYNTLEMIYGRAVNAGQTEVGEMVMALSLLFRRALNKGSAWIELESEQEWLESYLLLQQDCEPSMSYEIDFAPEVLQCMMPKLILQPLVENAYLHAVKGRDGGRICVHGWVEGDRLVLTVCDNGPGMCEKVIVRLSGEGDEAEAEQIEAMQAAWLQELAQEGTGQSATGGSGLALRNVRDRLRHYYPGRHALEFENRPGEGVCVWVKIPVMMKL